MDNASLNSLMQSFAEARGMVEFAFNQAVQQTKNQSAADKEGRTKKYNKDVAIVQNRVANTLNAEALRIRELVKSVEQTDNTILKAAEYIQLGTISVPEAAKLNALAASIPYVIPMLGHGNLALTGEGIAATGLAPAVVWSVLSRTAPGQLDIYLYNPLLKNDFSAFTPLDSTKTITKQDELRTLFDELSGEIMNSDSLINGKAESLIQLRKIAKQPIGRLKLVVMNDMSFLKSEEFRNQFSHIASNCVRAGIVLLCIDEKDATVASALSRISSFTVLQNSNNRLTDLRNSLDVKPALTLPADITRLIDAYQKDAESTSVVTIPFSDIEEKKETWWDTSAGGVTFAMGKRGLDVVTLRIGDDQTQLHNILISGAVGKGKSNLIEVIIHSICSRYDPDEVELYLLDFKDGLTFKPYGVADDDSFLPHAKVLGLESERDVGLATLEYIENIRQERARIFKNAGDFKGIKAFRKANPSVRMPRIIVVIDEFQKLFETTDSIGMEAAAVLENIVRQGRAFGIHIILASQTVTGAAALLGKESKIYAQFPVRIALQNSLNESYATFVTGNDGAAKLRVRGEAILNVNYGALNSNEKFSVAYAEPKAMRTLRSKWYKMWSEQYVPPVIFRKDEKVRVGSILPEIHKWRERISKEELSPVLPCGISLSVDRKAVSINFPNNPGCNVALLGAGEDIHDPDNLQNCAIGLLEIMSVSLALQHIDGNARFSLVNCLDKATFDRNTVNLWLSLMERLGYYVDVIDNKNAGQFFIQTAETLDQAQAENENHYIICMGLDRCTSMNDTKPAEPNAGIGIMQPLVLNPVTGQNSFQKILQSGSAKGTHVLSWWTSVTVYQDHIGFGGDGYLNTKILLRLDESSAQSILGPFTKWTVQSNRALVHDSIDLEEDTTTVPFIPLTQRDCGLIEAEDWNV